MPWEQIKQLGVAARLFPSDMLLPPGGQKWVRASTVEGLFPAPQAVVTSPLLKTLISKPKMFLSYRRADSLSVVGRIYDRLVEAFGRANIFKDVDSIPPGMDFRKVLNVAVAACGVLLAIIGRQWLTIADESGHRRLLNPDDFVRIEIESAIQRKILVIPVLVDQGTMPTPDNLLESLRELVYRNAVAIRHDPDFHNDMIRLMEKIKSIIQVQEIASADPGTIRAEFVEWQEVFLSILSTKTRLNERIAARLAIWKAAAERGIMEAQVLLGDCYGEGVGVAQDDSAAYQLLLPAANMGVACVAYNVGVLLSRGNGVVRNEAQAFLYFQKAAEAGFPPAFYRVGERLHKGVGVTPNLAKAVHWLKRSAEEAEDRKAMCNLAELYYEGGADVPRDLEAARTWFLKAQGQGVAFAGFKLKQVEQELCKLQQDRDQNAQLAACFQDNGDNTITDRKYRLVWIKQPDLLDPPFVQFGKAQEMEWDQAMEACRGMIYAGHSDWGLPTVPEWNFLFDDTSLSPLQVFKSLYSDFDTLWTASEDESDSERAWYVDINSSGKKKIDRTHKSRERHVVPVRKLGS